MNKGTRKILLTLLVVSFAVSIVAIVMSGKGPAKANPATSQASEQPVSGATPTPSTPQAPPANTAPATSVPATNPATPTAVVAPTVATAVSATAQKLKARAISATDAVPASLGSLDPAKDRFVVEFSRTGAGISRIAFSEFWVNAVDRAAAIRHATAVVSGANVVPPMPAESGRYVLAPVGKIGNFEVPMLAAHSIEVDGQLVTLFAGVWTEVSAGCFEAIVEDELGAAVMKVRRSFSVKPTEGDGYDITLAQSIENLTAAPHRVGVLQYGPSDLTRVANEMMDIRRLQFGYLMSTHRDPAQTSVITHDALLERAAVVKNIEAGKFGVWPSAEQESQDFHLSWFGMTNRYFSIAVHAPMAAGEGSTPSKSLSDSVEFIRAQLGEPSATALIAEPTLFTVLSSPQREVAPGKSVDFSMGVFAGPLDRTILRTEQPYSALEMSGLIVYSMGGCCSWCTFAWLANLMVVFLDFIHDYLVFDWALAIIMLVLVVRLLLHPISKKSQIQMQKLTRSMAEMKPELDALKSRYGDDPKRMQQEQMRLYKEKGVNPVGCVGGFLPTFLQMPIWMALYAVLYLAFELRQQPAFFGIFQLFGGWEFLGDLSSQDRFIPLSSPINLYFFNLTSINVIPLLMGAVFYVQQKYMAPPPSTQMTPEQEQQQKMMRIMTVVMFPVMLYAAPSGLTLYIMTSTLVGIWESKLVRKHILETANQPVVVKKSKARDAMGRLYAKAMERAQEKQDSNRKFKDRR